MKDKSIRRIGPKPLTKRMREIVEYAFNNHTLTQREIAKHFGLSEQRISAIMKSDRVLETFPMFARRKVKGYTPKAAGTIGELLDQNDNLKVKWDVARSVLANEKILDNEAPQTQINVFQGLPTDELRRIVDETHNTTPDVVDTSLVDPE